MNKPKRTNLYISLFSLLISLLCSEIVLRIFARESVYIQYLSHAGLTPENKIYSSLEVFLDTKIPHIVKHREWQNYCANNLGFYDQEFAKKEDSSITRILSLGDSFCYGYVSYPRNVQTLLEHYLNSEHGTEVEVLNLGVPATGIWDYKILGDLSIYRFNPDLVLVHIFLGNDPPDLLHNYYDFPKWKSTFLHSYLFTFIKNSIKLHTHARPVQKLGENSSKSENSDCLGGRKVEEHLDFIEGKSAYSQIGFEKVLEDEFGRFYKNKSLRK
jgi:hypothetical protein